MLVRVKIADPELDAAFTTSVLAPAVAVGTVTVTPAGMAPAAVVFTPAGETVIG